MHVPVGVHNATAFVPWILEFFSQILRELFLVAMYYVNVTHEPGSVVRNGAVFGLGLASGFNWGD